MGQRRKAASVLIWSEDGRVLGITRGLDANDVTLPGGRADPDDECRCAIPHHDREYATDAHTAARELWEETGVVVRPDALRPLVRDGIHTTFYATEIASWPEHLASRPFEGFVALWPAEKLLEPSCRYAEQYRYTFALVGLLPEYSWAQNALLAPDVRGYKRQLLR